MINQKRITPSLIFAQSTFLASFYFLPETHSLLRGVYI